MTDQPLNQRLREIREAHHEPVGEPVPEPARRTPLGRLLIDKGLLSEAVLDQALVRQRETGGPLGQILVELGAVSPQNLARTLTEQHGLDPAGSLRERLSTGDGDETSGEQTLDQAEDDSYLVRETNGHEPVHVASTLLDAADLAFELIEDRDPEQLEIVRARGGELEHIWSYRRADGDAPAVYPS
jgi:hypothetical protein